MESSSSLVSTRRIIQLGLISSLLLTCSQGIVPAENAEMRYSMAIPVQGNTWVPGDTEANQQLITETGIQNWSDPQHVVRTFFRLDRAGDIQIAIRAKAPSGQSTLKATFGGTSKTVKVTATAFEVVQLGTFQVKQPGYQYLDLQGISRTGDVFADISEVLIAGPATAGTVHYVKDDFYWGRRGPSVHLSFSLPEPDIRWFYNEITVPEGEDVLGSYFMANGFAEGYFGIQVNSPTERRILFSVWSPYQTDNPESIPEDQRIILLKKGQDVYAGKFGNEGSGGQSYLKFLWKAGNTYRFLLKGEPSVNNSTDYTAYFFAPETGRWQLIASFRRPKTTTYLKRLHSFLENFWTETGQTARQAYYSNQWVMDTGGKWHELTSARFTADATARKAARLDYAGGATADRFFLKNCGFFDGTTEIGSVFTRKASGRAPEIDFSTLE